MVDVPLSEELHGKDTQLTTHSTRKAPKRVSKLRSVAHRKRRGALKEKPKVKGQSCKSKKEYDMSFIQRELDRIDAVWRDGFNHPNARSFMRPSRLCFGIRSRTDSLPPLA